MTGARRALNVRACRLGTVGLGMLVLVLLLPDSSGSAHSAPPAPPLVSDWDVFARKGCARCHRIRGLGDGTIGPDLGRIDSGTGFIEIAAAMWNHVAEMRAQMGPNPTFVSRGAIRIRYEK